MNLVSRIAFIGLSCLRLENSLGLLDIAFALSLTYVEHARLDDLAAVFFFSTRIQHYINMAKEILNILLSGFLRITLVMLTVMRQILGWGLTVFFKLVVETGLLLVTYGPIFADCLRSFLQRIVYSSIGLKKLFVPKHTSLVNTEVSVEDKSQFLSGLDEYCPDICHSSNPGAQSECTWPSPIYADVGTRDSIWRQLFDGSFLMNSFGSMEHVTPIIRQHTVPNSTSLINDRIKSFAAADPREFRCSFVDFVKQMHIMYMVHGSQNGVTLVPSTCTNNPVCTGTAGAHLLTDCNAFITDYVVDSAEHWIALLYKIGVKHFACELVSRITKNGESETVSIQANQSFSQSEEKHEACHSSVLKPNEYPSPKNPCRLRCEAQNYTDDKEYTNDSMTADTSDGPRTEQSPTSDNENDDYNKFHSSSEDMLRTSINLTTNNCEEIITRGDTLIDTRDVGVQQNPKEEVSNSAYNMVRQIAVDLKETANEWDATDGACSEESQHKIDLFVENLVADLHEAAYSWIGQSALSQKDDGQTAIPSEMPVIVEDDDKSVTKRDILDGDAITKLEIQGSITDSVQRTTHANDGAASVIAVDQAEIQRACSSTPATSDSSDQQMDENGSNVESQVDVTRNEASTCYEDRHNEQSDMISVDDNQSPNNNQSVDTDTDTKNQNVSQIQMIRPTTPDTILTAEIDTIASNIHTTSEVQLYHDGQARDTMGTLYASENHIIPMATQEQEEYVLREMQKPNGTNVTDHTRAFPTCMTPAAGATVALVGAASVFGCMWFRKT